MGITRRRAGLLLALLTLLGFALRLPLLTRFPLREDEAIYGYWALHGLYIDPLFLHVWPDKPPLFLWLQGLAFSLWGHGPATAEPAARLLNIFAGALTIPVLAVTARRWWGERAALAAAVLAALNPFAISFAPTAFTDPLLVLAGGLALALAAHRRPFWAGLCLGAAIMTKQQGLLFLPLVAANSFLEAVTTTSPHPDPHGPFLEGIRLSAPLLLGLALVTLPILYWDSLRWAVAPSPWDLGATNVGGIQWAAPTAWLARAAGWGQLAWYLLASPGAWLVYALALSGAGGLAARRSPAAARLPALLPVLLLAGWAAGFLLLHIVTTVQVWDRYLLPLTIPLTLLGGWAAAKLAAPRTPSPVGRASSPTSSHHPSPSSPVGRASSPTWILSTWERCRATSPTYAIKGGALLLALLLTLPPAFQASQGQLPVGGDHGDYTGLDAALAAVDGPHTLLFHRELGWHARFALFDRVRSGAVELRYYPSSVYLADSAAKSPHKNRYVILPDWSPLPDLPMQLTMRGLQVQEVLRAGHFTVYQIDERPTGDQSWRVCAFPRPLLPTDLTPNAADPFFLPFAARSEE